MSRGLGRDRGGAHPARAVLALTRMEPVDSIADNLRRYLAEREDRPATILELVQRVDDPWLRPETRADVVAAVENLCAEGLLEEYRSVGGRSFYRLSTGVETAESAPSIGRDEP